MKEFRDSFTWGLIHLNAATAFHEGKFGSGNK